MGGADENKFISKLYYQKTVNFQGFIVFHQKRSECLYFIPKRSRKPLQLPCISCNAHFDSV